MYDKQWFERLYHLKMLVIVVMILMCDVKVVQKGYWAVSRTSHDRNQRPPSL